MAIVMCVTKGSESAEKSELPVVQCPEFENSVHATSFVGKVFATRERNGYDDSDFYAVVWDGTSVRNVEYGTTRAWTYHNSAAADATPETTEAANAWGKVAARKLARTEAVEKATQVEKGKRVKVTRGRKVAKGTEGVVIWVGTSPGYTRWAPVQHRVGFKTDAGETIFTAASNVEVTDPEMYLPGSEELDEIAAKATWNKVWSYWQAMGAGASGFAFVR